MALASYGKPVFVNAFRSMIHLADNGQYSIEDDHILELLGPARKKGDEFNAHHFNIAHSLQAVLQESVLQLSEWLYKETNKENLCFAGKSVSLGSTVAGPASR